MSAIRGRRAAVTASAGASLACHATQMSPNSLKPKHFNSFAGTFSACASANWGEKKTFPLRLGVRSVFPSGISSVRTIPLTVRVIREGTVADSCSLRS